MDKKKEEKLKRQIEFLEKKLPKLVFIGWMVGFATILIQLFWRG